ncbi:MAG: MgtC/SapB family protein [Elusimicrobia bacterium]|nr:MgtC/SapB family protein [Elusimicrobiota bacterium]
MINQDLMKLLISLCLGGVIGLEREVSDKAAGLRTHILICLGATLFTVLSVRFYGGSDPTRIAAQIVSGIGFLGAGAIMREGDRVTGLTTAATIWTVAAIGMGVGLGYHNEAAFATVLVLFIQLAFTKLDILIDDWRERHTYKIISKFDHGHIEEIAGIFREARVRIMRRKLMKKNGFYYSEWYTTGSRASQEKVMKRLIDFKDVMEVSY